MSTRLSKSDRVFWAKYGIDPGVPSGKFMTTEQLGEAMLRTVQQMTPEEKAEVRKELDKAFGGRKSGVRTPPPEWVN